MNEREFFIAMNMISGIGFNRCMALLDKFGTACDVRAADRGDLQSISGFGKVLAERIVSFDWDAELSREKAAAERGGVKIITIADEDYPDALRELFDPPLCLYVRGVLPKDYGKNIAVVGSRRVSSYGGKMAKMLAEEAAACGFNVVSGLALGVDTIVHDAVVACAARTVGVLAGGLMHMYPKENIPLARKMIQNGGAVISEMPLDFPISRQNFPRRNRIVAGLCRATIVVEAGVDSGALITARLAAEMGREVFAVPGRVDNMQSRGCHKLIKEGAGLIENFEDVMLALDTGMRPGENDFSSGGVCGSGDLSAECEAVYQILQKGEATLDELQEYSGMEPGALLAALMNLEMKLLVECDAFHYYRIVK